MKIGNIIFGQKPVFLAPMEDVTDLAFRLMCREFGADLVYTEFVSADSLIRNVQGTHRKLHVSDRERPVAMQIYGKDTETMVEAAKIVETAQPDILDINFGCPVRKIATKGAGAGLLRDIPKMLEITREVVKAVSLPVSVKTRLGWDDDTKHIVEIAEQLQDAGAAAIAIHGRTREQMYRGQADWTLIGEVKKNPRMQIPIIGNGDIASAVDAEMAFERYGVDGIMVGRATIGAPWIFREIRDALDGIESKPFSLEQKIGVLKQMINNNIDWLEEKRGILHSRRHLAVSSALKNWPDFRQTRVAILRAETKSVLFELLDGVVAEYSKSQD